MGEYVVVVVAASYDVVAGHSLKLLEIFLAWHLPGVGFMIIDARDPGGAGSLTIKAAALRAGKIWRVYDGEVEGFVGKLA